MGISLALTGLYSLIISLRTRVDVVSNELFIHKTENVHAGAVALDATSWYVVDRCIGGANLHYVKDSVSGKFFSISVAHLECGGLPPNNALVCPGIDVVIFPSCPSGKTFSLTKINVA